MAFNLLITYDLITPGQNYDAVRKQIESLGRFRQIQYSAYYVHSAYSPDEAFAHVRAVMDTNDKLAVADIKRVVLTEPDDVIDAINSVWNT